MANIEINGIKINAREGAMLIEAADDAGIYIPRFCYHKKLSIAANCRMCLVEVEKVGKPLPACATPVTDGMKIFTKSPRAIEAQKSVMEFLLINHPLDCPICDQGGECELQDIAVGYGNDLSRFSENKRVVEDKNLGPLIATDMTRCIHCTRCVRFGEEISGLREMGATGRGEHMEIGTYITKSVTSELSGNVIDLCPVGALTSKPFRFSARAWELIQRQTIAPHDCLGSNINVHIRGKEVVRVVPTENEDINETWISDRDRFSYEGLNSEERLRQPMIKVNGEWQETDWNSALNHVVNNINKVIQDYGSQNIGALASATATVEELYLFQKLLRELEISNIDHRTRQLNFDDQEDSPVYPSLGQAIKDLENNDAVLLIGSNIRFDQPLAAHRLRKACLHDAKIMCVNPVDYEFNFPVSEKCVVNPKLLSVTLANIAKALIEITGKSAPKGFAKLLDNFNVESEHTAIANALIDGKLTSVLLGPLSINHEQFSTIRMLASLIADMSGSNFGYLTESGNVSGAWLAGMLPHRASAGKPVKNAGLTANDMFQQQLNAYILLGLEPNVDNAHPTKAYKALKNADFVVSLSVFTNDTIQEYADVLLPIAPFSETSGTFVNIEGVWQSFNGVVPPLGEARPAWKIFRVIGNLFNLKGFEHTSSEEVRDELLAQVKDKSNNKMTWVCPQKLQKIDSDIVRIAETQIYSGDGLQRRAISLQNTMDAHAAEIRINEVLANQIGVTNGDHAIAAQNDQQLSLPVVVDNRISDNGVLIYAGLRECAGFDANLSSVTLKRV